jgi:hypothetical protein
MSDRALRWALMLHPRSWRERYGEEVRDLSEELLAVGHLRWPRLVLGLLGSAMVERIRSLLRMGRLAVLSVFAAALVTFGAIAFAANLFGSGGTPPSTPSLTAGTVPFPVQGGSVNPKRIPDFIETVGRTGKVVGYVPRAYLFPVARVNAPVSSKLGDVSPVYARDLKTLVGHMYPGVGFVPLGTSPTSEPCVNEYTISSEGGNTTTSTIACPTTMEVVPNLVGMDLPTAMGELSGMSLNGQISYVHSSSVPGGHIVSVSPAPGTRVSARSQVRILSSVSPGIALPGS